MNKGLVKRRNYELLCSYGANLTSLADRACAILLALSPILQHYVGVYENAGFTILLLVFPVLLFRFVCQMHVGAKRNSYFVALVPLMLYHLYTMCIHGMSVGKLLYNFYMVFFIIFIALKCVNVSCLVKTAVFICELASAVLILQYFCFYVLGFHLQVVPTELLLEESSSWILGAKTGLYNIRGQYNGFYRPSAFFLEPSHCAIFSIPCLCLLLLSSTVEKWRIKKAIFITVGIILSTSGIGIVFSVFVWGLYLILYSAEKKAIQKKFTLSVNSIVLCAATILLVTILYFTVDVIRNSVNRIFFEGGSSSAIGGRVNQASNLVRGLSGKAIWFGFTDDASNIIFNMPGFFATFYKKGVIGLILSYAYYCQGLFKTKERFFWLSLIIVILSFFSAQTHGTFYMLYFVMFLGDGYVNRQDLEICEREMLYDKT